MDVNGATQTWNVLSNAIDEIYNRNASLLSFEELYRNAYNLVLHKHGNFLYEGVTEKIQLHLQATVTSILLADDSVMDTGGNAQFLLLDRMTTTWNEHLITMTMIRDILMYMDRTYVHQSRRRPVYELGLHLFRVAVWEHPAIGQRVVNLVLQAIKEQRQGYASSASASSSSAAAASATVSAHNAMDIDHRDDAAGNGGNEAVDHDRTTKVKQVLQMLQLLSRADYTTNVYQDFEQTFLATTQEWYHAESLDYLSNNSASAYVTKATLRLQQERERAHTLQLPSTTEGPLLQIVQTEFIERHAKTLVDLENSGFAALLVQEAAATTTTGATSGSGIAASDDTTGNSGGGTGEDDGSKLLEMQQMYDLFVRVPSSVDHLRDALADRIKTDGKLLMLDQEKSSGTNGGGASDPSAFCRGVLAMREKYSRVVQVAFRQEKKAQKRLKESFEFFLNYDARAASCLAVYVDELLRTGLRGASDDVVQQELMKSIVVFRYLSDKDVFESFYKQHLAKRLLGGRSVSDDAERAMVSLLKAECGYQFTTKLEGMFNDMRISRETRDKYKAFKRQQEECNKASSGSSNSSKLLDIEVDVLTTGYWPSQNVPPCTLPVPVQEAIDRFSSFYLEKHTGRKLSWQTSAGQAELRATFGGGGSAGTSKPKRVHELCVSTYQMCILLLYNEPFVNVLTLGQIRSKTHIPGEC
jgi:cullin 3